MSSNPLMTRLGGGTASPLPNSAGNTPYPQTYIQAPATVGVQQGMSKPGLTGGIQYQETQYSGLQGTYNPPVATGGNAQQGGGLRDYLSKVVNEPPRQVSPAPAYQPGISRQGNSMNDSTGLNFDFKEKIKDSTFTAGIGEGGQPWSAIPATQQHSILAQERYARTGGAPVPTTTSKLVDYNSNEQAGFKQSGGFRGPSGHTSSTFSKEQIEFGDWSEKFRQVVTQNKELKELVMTKENSLNEIRQHTAKLEKELQNIMDPLGKSSQLKQKYKETLIEKDKRISDLELENHNIKKELREATQARKEAESKLEGIEAKHRQAIYELKLQLEDKARKQMVVPDITEGIVCS